MSRLAVRVQPGAKRNALLGRLPGGGWKVAVSAPPEDGRANEAVVELLSELLGVRRRQLVVARGASSRSKWIELTGLDGTEAERRLAAHLGPGTEDEGSAHGE